MYFNEKKFLEDNDKEIVFFFLDGKYNEKEIRKYYYRYIYSLSLHINPGFCQNKTNLINLSFMSIPFIYLHERGA